MENTTKQLSVPILPGKESVDYTSPTLTHVSLSSENGRFLSTLNISLGQ